MALGLVAGRAVGDSQRYSLSFHQRRLFLGPSYLATPFPKPCASYWATKLTVVLKEKVICGVFGGVVTVSPVPSLLTSLFIHKLRCQALGIAELQEGKGLDS